MRNLKKFFAVVLVVALMITSMATAFAATAPAGTDEGNALKELGLYTGIEGSLALDNQVKRFEGMLLLGKMLGLVEVAAAEYPTDKDAMDALKAFSDAKDIPYLEAKQVIAYMVSNGMVQGGDGLLMPTKLLNTSAEFATMIARYVAADETIEPADALAALAERNAFTAAQVAKFAANPKFTRAELVQVAYYGLKAEDDEGVSIIEALAADNEELEAIAIDMGLIVPITIEEVAAVADQTITVGAKPVLPEEVEATYSDGTKANVAVVWEDVDTATAGEKTVKGTIEGYEAGITAKVTVNALTLAVDSVTAINAKQVEVKFNKEMDPTAAATATNYTVGGVVFGKAVLQADKKTVILTLAGETMMTNAGTADIKVLKAVKDATGTALTADYAKTVTITDTKLPEVVNVEATGLKTIKITFDEPVYDAQGNVDFDLDQITVKSGIYTYVVTAIKADYAARTVTVTTGTNLLAGDVTVKINAQGMTDLQAIRDFAGLTTLMQEKTFTYAADTTTATVTLTAVGKESKIATVTFSKAVYGANVVLYHSVNGVSAYATSPVTKTEANAATAWDFEFQNALPAGNLTFYLVNSATASEQLTDLYGVKIANQTLTFNVVADTTAPTVSTVTVNTNASIDIAFSEAVDATEKVKADNYEILKADGTKVAFSTSSIDSKTVRLTTGAALTDNATYTVNVKSMKDAAGVAMAAAYSVQKTVGDNVNPTATVYTTANNTIYVSYSENMNEADITNKLNYLVDANDDGTYAALGSNDTITLISPKKVKITWAAADFTGGADRIQIGAVRDLAGKKLGFDNVFVTSYDDVASDSLTFTAQVIALNKLKLTFNKQVAAFDNAEFTVAGATVAQIESMTVNADGYTEVILVLDANLAAGTIPNITTAASPSKTKSVEGTVLVGATVVASVDKVAPTFTAEFINSTTIHVIFDKNIEADLVGYAGKNGFSVAGGTLTSALMEVNGTDGRLMVLTGTDFTANTDVTYTPGYIADNTASKNALAAKTITDAIVSAAGTAVTAYEALAVSTIAEVNTAVTNAGTAATAAIAASTAPAGTKTALTARVTAKTAAINTQNAKITTLTAAIASAQTLHNGATEGVASGNYAVGSKATFQAAITAANTVATTTTSTIAAVESATTTLATARTAFTATLVP